MSPHGQAHWKQSYILDQTVTKWVVTLKDQCKSGHSFTSENVGEVESDGDIYGILFLGGYFWKEEKKMTENMKPKSFPSFKDLRAWTMFRYH